MEGMGPENRERVFRALKWQRAKRVPFGPKKSGQIEFTLSRQNRTEQFKNQQRFEKCVRYVSGT
jgi:hypothetical protein